MNKFSRTTILLFALLASIILLLILYIVMMIKITASLEILGLILILIILCATGAATFLQIKADKKSIAQPTPEVPKDEPIAEQPKVEETK